MKKVVLCALLLAAVAMSASAETYVGNNGVSYSGPNRGALYSCDYTNYSGSAVDPGYSYWTLTVFQDASGKPMPRGTEFFLATLPNGQQFWENNKATWAKPVNKIDPLTYTTYTQWEYTFNPSGPQCTKANAFFGGYKLTFGDCSDGHSRICWLVN